MLLSDTLGTIGEECFAKSGLKKVSIPVSVRRICHGAFSRSSLGQVRFLGTVKKKPLRPGKCNNHAENGSSDSERRLVIGTQAFAECNKLKQVVFDPGSAVEEI